MERVVLVSMLFCLALNVRGESQTPLPPSSQIQPILSTPAPFAPFAFPGTIQPSSFVNPFFSGGFLSPEIIPPQSHSFLPVFSNPPQLQPVSNIFLPSGFPTDSGTSQIFQSDSNQDGEPQLDDGQSKRLTLSELLAVANSGSSLTSQPPSFSTLNSKVNKNINAEESVARRSKTVNLDNNIKLETTVQSAEQRNLQEIHGSSTPSSPEGSLTTPVPLSSPPTEATLSSQTTSSTRSPSLLRQTEDTELNEENSEGSSVNNSNGQFSLASHIEQLKFQLSQSMKEGVSQTEDEFHPSDTEGRKPSTHISSDRDIPHGRINRKSLFQTLAESQMIKQESSPRSFDNEDNRPLETEGQETIIHNSEDSDIQPIDTDKNPLFQTLAESQLIEQESSTKSLDNEDNSPLETEGQETIIHNFEDTDIQPIDTDKKPLFQHLAESRMIVHESLPTPVDNKDTSEPLISDASDSLSVTTFDSSDSFHDASANQAAEQDITEKNLGIKHNTISDNTEPFNEHTTVQSDDYEDDPNENQKISKSLLPEANDEPSLVTQSTTTSTESPRENRPLRQGRRERPSSREQLIERLKKLRERRLSTTRPHLAAQRKEAQKSDNSTNTTALRERRLNNRRRFDQRGDDFYNRLRNRVFTTRVPNRDRPVTREKESPVVLNRPTTPKPLSFRERLNRYRENNRFIPKDRRLTTPRTTLRQTSTTRTTSLATSEESNTEEYEYETETNPTVDLPTFTTDPPSKSKVQEIMDKIAATISQKALQEKTTTEEVLLALNDVTDKPLFTELSPLITTTPEPTESIADIDFNTFPTVKAPEEERETTVAQIDELKSTIINDIKTSEVPSLSLITSSAITSPSLLTTPENTSPIPSAQFSPVPESIPVSHISEETPTSSQENFVSSTTLRESLSLGNKILKKEPPSTTEMILELEQTSPKSSLPSSESEHAMQSTPDEGSTDPALETTSQGSRLGEPTVDEASIQALIAKLIAQGVITEAKPEENVSFTTEKEDDEAITGQLDNSTTQPTQLLDTSDLDSDISTVLPESSDGLVETHSSNTRFDFSEGGIPSTLPTTIDIENVPLTFVPFIKRTSVDPIPLHDTTKKFNNDINELHTEVPSISESEFDVQQGAVNAFNNFFGIPPEQNTAEDSESTSKNSANDIEVHISDSMDHLQTLLRSFGSSSIRPELAAVNRVIGLSLFDPPHSNDTSVNTNLEEPELLNDYAFYDYDLEAAATEQVLFTAKLETFPFETQTSDFQEHITESSTDSQDITVTENLVPTVLNMDVASLSVSEPSVKVQNVTQEDVLSNIRDHLIATNGTMGQKVDSFDKIIQPNTSDIPFVMDSKIERIHKEPLLSEVLMDEPQSPHLSAEIKEIERSNSSVSDLPVIFEDANSKTVATNETLFKNLENDEGNETTQLPLMDTTPFIVNNEQDVISKERVSENRTLDEESVPLMKENTTPEFVEITTIEPLVVSASDNIPQNVMTQNKRPHNSPSSFTLQKKVGQTDTITQPDETKEPSHLGDRNTTQHSTVLPSNIDKVEESSPVSSPQLTSDARSKAIVRERPDLLLLLRGRDSNGKKQSDTQHLPPHREANVSSERVRIVPETVTQPSLRGRVSLSQLLSLKTALGASKSEPAGETHNNSFIKFLMDVTTTQQPFLTVKNIEEVSQPVRGHATNLTIIQGVKENFEKSQEPDTTKEITDIFVSSSAEGSQKGPVRTEIVNGTSKASDADKQKEIALQRFLALNREMLKSLRNGRKTTPAVSVTKHPVIDDDIAETTVSSITPKTRFHGGTEKNPKEPHGSDTQNKPTAFLRPVPQPRLFNITSIGSLLLTEKSAFSSNQSHAHPKIGPTQFLRPSANKNSSRVHVTPAGRFHHPVSTSRFLDPKISLRNISDNTNIHLPLLPRPTQHNINEKVVKTETTTKSSTSFFIPFAQEQFMSATTTNAPIIVQKHSEENNPVNQRSNKGRAHRVSTVIPTTPRPNRGQFTTLASLIKSKNPTTFKPDITTPGFEAETENGNDFISKLMGQNIENFPSTTILPYFAEDEEDTTQLGPLDIDPMTISPDEFETTIIPKTVEGLVVFPAAEGITIPSSGDIADFEVHKNVPPPNEVADVRNKHPEQNFRPSKFFSITSTTSRPPSTLNPNTSLQRKGIAHSSANLSSGFSTSSHNQGIRSGVPLMTERNKIPWKPVTLSNLREKFDASATTTSPFSFSDIFTTDREPESVTTSPSINEFDFGLTASVPLSGQSQQIQADLSTTGTPTPTVLITTLPTFANEDIFFTDDDPSQDVENEQINNIAITDRVPTSTVPTVAVTPKIILLALPIVNTSSLQGITTLAPQTGRIDHNNPSTRVTPSQLLRHKAKEQNNNQGQTSESKQHSNLRQIFLASLPVGTRPQKQAEPKNNILHTTPQNFPHLRQSITGGVSIRAEEGIIQRNPITSQREFQGGSQQQDFSSGGFITTTPSPISATTQVPDDIITTLKSILTKGNGLGNSFGEGLTTINPITTNAFTTTNPPTTNELATGFAPGFKHNSIRFLPSTTTTTTTTTTNRPFPVTEPSSSKEPSSTKSPNTGRIPTKQLGLETGMQDETHKKNNSAQHRFTLGTTNVPVTNPDDVLHSLTTTLRPDFFSSTEAALTNDNGSPSSLLTKPSTFLSPLTTFGPSNNNNNNNNKDTNITRNPVHSVFDEKTNNKNSQSHTNRLVPFLSTTSSPKTTTERGNFNTLASILNINRNSSTTSRTTTTTTTQAPITSSFRTTTAKAIPTHIPLSSINRLSGVFPEQAVSSRLISDSSGTDARKPSLEPPFTFSFATGTSTINDGDPDHPPPNSIPFRFDGHGNMIFPHDTKDRLNASIVPVPSFAGHGSIRFTTASNPSIFTPTPVPGTKSATTFPNLDFTIPDNPFNGRGSIRFFLNPSERQGQTLNGNNVAPSFPLPTLTPPPIVNLPVNPVGRHIEQNSNSNTVPSFPLSSFPLSSSFQGISPALPSSNAKNPQSLHNFHSPPTASSNPFPTVPSTPFVPSEVDPLHLTSLTPPTVEFSSPGSFFINGHPQFTSNPFVSQPQFIIPTILPDTSTPQSFVSFSSDSSQFLDEGEASVVTTSIPHHFSETTEASLLQNVTQTPAEKNPMVVSSPSDLMELKNSNSLIKSSTPSPIEFLSFTSELADILAQNSALNSKSDNQSQSTDSFLQILTSNNPSLASVSTDSVQPHDFNSQIVTSQQSSNLPSSSDNESHNFNVFPQEVNTSAGSTFIQGDSAQQQNLKSPHGNSAQNAPISIPLFIEPPEKTNHLPSSSTLNHPSSNAFKQFQNSAPAPFPNKPTQNLNTLVQPQKINTPGSGFNLGGSHHQGPNLSQSSVQVNNPPFFPHNSPQISNTFTSSSSDNTNSHFTSSHTNSAVIPAKLNDNPSILSSNLLKPHQGTNNPPQTSIFSPSFRPVFNTPVQTSSKDVTVHSRNSSSKSAQNSQSSQIPGLSFPLPLPISNNQFSRNSFSINNGRRGSAKFTSTTSSTTTPPFKNTRPPLALVSNKIPQPTPPTRGPSLLVPFGINEESGLDGSSVDNDPDNDHIPGEGGVDYPILDFIPETSFRCTKSLSKSGMMYADPETACQVYHVCNGIQKFSFLCPRGTIFHQETVVCQWWYTVDCVAQARKLADIQAVGES